MAEIKNPPFAIACKIKLYNLNLGIGFMMNR